jgi:tight adherence protein B
VTALVVAAVGAYGVHLVYTAVALGWHGVAPGPPSGRPLRHRVDASTWMRQAGLDEIEPAQFVAVVGAMAAAASAVGFALFGGLGPALAVGAFAATFPPAAYRARRTARRARAQDAWPRMIDELRILTGSAGLPIPHALFEVGRRAPAELRGGFRAAEREWLLSTDFARTLSVLKATLADPTCDATCETLLVANDLGGADLHRRLASLAEDRLHEVQGRKDARARQAGARFARRFVLLVPIGMALAGLSLGTGREGYRTAPGQVAVAVGVAMVAACWLWAGRIMRVPEEQRVFAE